MPDTEYLRQAMHAETSDLPMHLTVDGIRRRARGLRARRTAVVAGACVLITAAAVPAYALHSGRAGRPPADPPSTADSSGCYVGIDPFFYRHTWIDTGVSIKGTDGQQYEAFFTSLSLPESNAALAVVFVHQKTNSRSALIVTGAGRHADGEFTVDGSAGTQRYQFLSKQLMLGPDRVLDFGIYSGAADRITVASEGRGSEAQVRANDNGWTTFWVVRNAKPLPKGADTGAGGYTGPERLTITAYGSQGQVLDTVTGGLKTGQHTENPRDNWSDLAPEAVPTDTGLDGFPGVCGVVGSGFARAYTTSTP